MTTDATASPLRHNGIYQFRGHEYTAMHLATGGEPWRSTGLIRWEPGAPMPNDLIYLRHADGVLISARDFEPIGTLNDLVDAGRDAETD